MGSCEQMRHKKLRHFSQCLQRMDGREGLEQKRIPKHLAKCALSQEERIEEIGRWQKISMEDVKRVQANCGIIIQSLPQAGGQLCIQFNPCLCTTAPNKTNQRWIEVLIKLILGIRYAVEGAHDQYLHHGSEITITSSDAPICSQGEQGKICLVRWYDATN